MLCPGAEVRLDKLGITCVVEKLLGEGGQGAVWAARSAKGQGPRQQYALKWYQPAAATQEQWDLLLNLIDRRSPHERFLWPIDAATAAGVPSFGYVMPLKRPEDRTMAEFLGGKTEDVKFRELTTIGVELADSFCILHTQGLCYRDISDRNVFLKPDDGSVRIPDCDNVGIDAMSPGTVKGTLGYMAPEVIRGEAEPSTTSDQFSLAVMLFQLLMLSHPLEGRRVLDFDLWNRDAQLDVYAANPVFVFSPDDASNRPVLGHHDNVLAFWPIYPEFLRERFTQAFTIGIDDPVNGRVQESQWRADMVRLRDAIVYCSSCKKQNFFDQAASALTCWSCHANISTPLRIRIEHNRRQSSVMLNHDAKLFPHHLWLNYDFSTPAARVEKHPVDPKRWGLKNLTDVTWAATDSDGREHELPPGRSIALMPGLRLKLGNARAEIVYP